MTEDSYIGLAAIFVAFCALALAVYEGRANRKHNKLSVKPHLTLVWSNIEDKVLDVHVINSGSGPAIIEAFEVSFNKKASTHNSWKDAFLNHDANFNDAVHYELYAGEAIGQGEKVRLLKMKFEDKNHKDSANIFSKLYLNIKYSCLYGIPGYTELSSGKAKTI